LPPRKYDLSEILDIQTETVEGNHRYFSEFIGHLRRVGRSPSTLTAYASDLRHFTAWYSARFNNRFTIDQLEPADVEAYLSWGQDQGFKPTTLNRRLSVIKRYIHWCRRNGIINGQVQVEIDDITTQKPAELIPEGLNKQQKERLLTVFENKANIRDRAIILVLLNTGLRVSELVALEPKDVEVSRNESVIHIRKNGASRSIPLPSTASKALATYLEVRPSELGKGLFIGRQGSLTKEGIAAMIARYAEQASLIGITPNTLRHTFAYEYLEQNKNDVVKLAEILGHSDLNSTRIYLRRWSVKIQNGASDTSIARNGD
jgi:site-specific recombinase XerD